MWVVQLIALSILNAVELNKVKVVVGLRQYILKNLFGIATTSTITKNVHLKKLVVDFSTKKLEFAYLGKNVKYDFAPSHTLTKDILRAI